jgi:hypothetical protein
MNISPALFALRSHCNFNVYEKAGVLSRPTINERSSVNVPWDQSIFFIPKAKGVKD